MAELKNKRIITVALTGAWPKKENNPNVPMTPAEISEDIYACWKAGAAVAHMHMRDDDGNGTMDVNKFRETVELLRKNHPECDIVLNMTTSGDLNATEETRQIHLKELRPEMGSYDCGSMNWMNSGLFINSPKFLEELGRNMQEWNVKPEIEAFDPGMIANAAYYLKKGVLKAPLHFQFCMGCANGIVGSTKNLVFMKETMDSLCPGSTWSCFGVGHSAMEIMYAGVAMGGHIRVGMEDNVMYAKGQLAESNVQFVERAKRVIEEFGCQAATPDEARQILSLLTGQGTVQRDVQIIRQAGSDGQLGNVDGPAVAHQLLDLGIIAQCHQQHLGKLYAQHLVSGVKLAVAIAGNDALVGAVGNRACAPAVGRHVGIGRHSGRQLVSFLLAQQHVGNDLRSLLTVQRVRGVEVSAVAAVEHAGGSHNINCFFVGDFIVILVVTCVRGEGGGHQAQCHGQRQHQGQNLFQILHGSVVLLL